MGAKLRALLVGWFETPVPPWVPAFLFVLVVMFLTHDWHDLSPNVQHAGKFLLWVLLIATIASLRSGRKRIQPLAAVPDLATELETWRDDVSVLAQPEAFGYRVYTKIHDEVATPATLSTPSDLKRLRAKLDARLVEAGITPLDPHRASPAFRISDGLAVTLLLDNSGSLRKPPGEEWPAQKTGSPPAPIGDAKPESKAMLLACIADLLTRRLEGAGVAVEVLGFTTARWRGGLSREEWLAAGKPEYPGRLNDLRHILYKEFGQPHAAAAVNFALMLDERILKENIDGEAVTWAQSRLAVRAKHRKVLAVLSDGAPVDDSTLYANGTSYLERHLRHVIRDIETRGRVGLVGIGIGHDVSRTYERAFDTGTATIPDEGMITRLLQIIVDAAPPAAP